MQIVNLNQAPEQVQTLACWHYRAWAALYPEETLDDFVADLDACLTDAPVPSTWLALDQEPLGSVSILARDLYSRPELTPWLANLYVAPEYRGAGIATALIRHAMQDARRAGLNRLYLFTPDHALFYKRLGWSILSTENIRGRAVTLMQVKFDD